MARPRTFDEEHALDAAMRAFWERGYEATSTDDLCSATGLRRSSIYNAFASKHDLFVRALERYAEGRTAALLATLAEPRPLADRLRDVLMTAAHPDPADPVGCFVVNTQIELAGRDAEVARVLERDQRRRLAALRRAIAEARAEGELGPDADPAALARFVVATVSGMRVAARGGAGRAALEEIATTALRAL